MKRKEHVAASLAVGAAMLFSVCSLVPGTATAQTRPDAWQFRAMIYGYFPELGGSTTFPAGTGSSISVDADTIIDNLKFVFMGTLEAQRGPWGAFTDIIYIDIGGSRSDTRNLTVGGVQLPAGVTTSAQLDVKGWVWTLAGNYRVMSTPEATFDVFAGARMLDAEEKFGWEFSANVSGVGRQGSSEAELQNWDGIVGVKGRLNFGARREWFVPYYLDVGTGESDLTWQAMAGIGYAFGWGEVVGGWRYLDYEFKSGKKIEDLNFSGPMVGVAFRW